MEVPLDDIATTFAAAADAAIRGERVVVTKDGKPLVELVSVQADADEDRVNAYFERLQSIRRKLGITDIENVWPPEFDDPAFSRAVLGLDD